MHDKFKRRHQVPKATERVRRQIAVEAARRLYEVIGPDPDDPSTRLRDATEAEFYTAKRKAAAVLGHAVRPGDLPSDAEVRAEVLTWARSKGGQAGSTFDQPEPAPDAAPLALADHLDRFAVYRLRLAPLEAVKQNPKSHPEGDALYHSLQVFEHARAARPFDEEFLLAALLHDVGKAIEPANHIAAAVAALRGAVPERTLWLIEHHGDLPALRDRDRAISHKIWRALDAPAELLDDLRLLRDVDDAGRVPGAPVEGLDEALEYLEGLENESYLA